MDNIMFDNYTLSDNARRHIYNRIDAVIDHSTSQRDTSERILKDIARDIRVHFGGMIPVQVFAILSIMEHPVDHPEITVESLISLKQLYGGSDYGIIAAILQAFNDINDYIKDTLG